jgi:hypothetical protein
MYHTISTMLYQIWLLYILAKVLSKFHSIVTWRLIAGVVEEVEAVLARQQHGKQASAATDIDATMRTWCFQYGPCQGYGKDQQDKLVSQTEAGMSG